MWWDPSNEDEEAVMFWLSEATAHFLKNTPESLVWGVGSYLSGESLRPLVLVDESVLGHSPIGLSIVPLSLMKDEVVEQVIALNPPKDAVLGFVAAPAQLASRVNITVQLGDTTRCTTTGSTGSVGAPLRLASGANGLLTAGHVTPQANGSSIDLIRKHLFFPSQTYATGIVALHRDPVAQVAAADYDVAVIELPAGQTNTNINGLSVARLGPNLAQPVMCTLRGAVSGTKSHTSIIGALTAYGDPSGRCWKNCWLFQPATAAARGDSGSLITVNANGDGVGMLVGGSQCVSTDSWQCWYAHDLYSLQKEVLSPAGITIT